MTIALDHPAIVAYLSADTPHPAFIRTTAVHVLKLRATRLGVLRPRLENLADQFLRYAKHLDGKQWREWTDSCAAAELDQPTGEPDRTTFELPGFYGSTWGECWAPYGLQRRTFDVFDLPLDRAQGSPKKGRHVARLVAVEHLRGVWEVADVVVRQDRRRQGIATELYAAVERFTGAPIASPSGWLTSDALAFWERRRPCIDMHYGPVTSIRGLHVTEKQARFAMAAMQLDSLAQTDASCCGTA